MRTKQGDREQRPAEAAQGLAAEVAHLRALMDHAQDAIVEIGLDASLLYVGPRFSEIFGWQPGEILGKSVLELVHTPNTPAE